MSSPRRPPIASLRTRTGYLALLVAVWAGHAVGTAAASAELPSRLSDTGLDPSDPARGRPGGIVSFSPQYPLWSDGTDKRRWLHLPEGSFIDGSDPDAWQFPFGTRLWKEFALGGRPIETRMIERRGDGSWRFAAYVWTEDGTDAVLAPAAGVTLAVPQAPGGRYRVPSRADCLACHEGAAVPVLGLGALQLSPDRDPLAPHGRTPDPGAMDLRRLAERGWLRRLPERLLDRPPRITADNPVERAALGYLHGNCAHCHNASGSQVPVRLNLAQSAADPAGSRAQTLGSAVGADSRWRPPGTSGGAKVVVPGDADASALAQRMQSPHARTRMPPLGTVLPDREGLALVRRWIDHEITHDPSNRKEPGP